MTMAKDFLYSFAGKFLSKKFETFNIWITGVLRERIQTIGLFQTLQSAID